MDSIVETSIWQREPIYCARELSSPELYCLKKSAGRDIIRIMAAASTARFIFVLILPFIRLFAPFIIMLLMEVHTIKTVIATRSRILPDSITSEKSILFNRGATIPSKVTVIVAMIISTKSAAESVSSM